MLENLRRTACLGVLALFCLTNALAQSTTPFILTLPSSPRSVAVDPKTNLALITNSSGNSVSIVNLGTSPATLVRTVEGIDSPAGVAINSTTGRAVIVNQFTNSIQVMQLSTGQVLATIPVGSQPTGVAINPKTNGAVVVNSGDNSLSVINLTTGASAVIPSVPTAIGNQPVQTVAIDPDLNIAVVTSATTNSVFVISLAGTTLSSGVQVPVEFSPTGVAIDPVSKIAVVANSASNSVSLVDIRTATLVGSVPSIPTPQSVAIAPSARAALVTTGANSTLYVVDLNTSTIAGTISNLPSLLSVDFDSGNGKTIVTLPPNNSAGIIDSLGIVSVVNSASFALGGVAPLSIASAFGNGMSTFTTLATKTPLPFSLSAVTVTVGNSPAPLFFVSPGQINFQVPLLSPGSFPLTVALNGQTVGTGTVVVTAVSPALFTANSQGTGQASAINVKSATINGTSFPAHPGETIALFGTGGGLTNPNPVPGTAPTAAAPTNLKATVTVGGLSVEPTYSGVAPTLVGVWQVNVELPANVTLGLAVPVQVTIGGKASNVVTIVVQ